MIVLVVVVWIELADSTGGTIELEGETIGIELVTDPSRVMVTKAVETS